MHVWVKISDNELDLHIRKGMKLSDWRRLKREWLKYNKEGKVITAAIELDAERIQQLAMDYGMTMCFANGQSLFFTNRQRHG